MLYMLGTLNCRVTLSCHARARHESHAIKETCAWHYLIGTARKTLHQAHMFILCIFRTSTIVHTIMYIDMHLGKAFFARSLHRGCHRLAHTPRTNTSDDTHGHAMIVLRLHTTNPAGARGEAVVGKAPLPLRSDRAEPRLQGPATLALHPLSFTPRSLSFSISVF